MKYYLNLVVSYETGGGHGEHDAIEEGLTSMLENNYIQCPECGQDTPKIPFKVEMLDSISETKALDIMEAETEDGEVFCGNCGFLMMHPKESQCPKCGYPVDAKEQEEWNKKQS